MGNIMKRILTYGFLLMIGLSSVGCSHAIIKNQIGGPEGITRSYKETTAPIKTKVITIKKIDGKIVIIREAK